MDRPKRRFRGVVIVVASVIVAASAGYWAGRHQGNGDRMADRESSISQPPLADSVAAPDCPDTATHPLPAQSSTGNEAEPRSLVANTDSPAAKSQPMPREPPSPDPISPELAPKEPVTPAPNPPVTRTPIDRDHAMDLFADRIAKLEEDSSDAEPDISAARDLRRFHALPDGGDPARQTERVLSDHLDEWLDSFPADRVDHLVLVSVQCRSGSCQILIAGNDINFMFSANDKDESFLDMFEQSFLALSGQAWWQEMGLQFMGISTNAAGKGSPPDYALWTIYLDIPTSSPPAS